MSRFTDNELYYLRSILRSLEQLKELSDEQVTWLGPSIGSEVLADNINWLDCLIDAESRPLVSSTEQKGAD
ncbi:hypothetical protein ACVWZ4_007219 [Bradyrhizobium sp. USDA 4472]